MRLSVSKIRLFKACRRAYQFKFVEGLNPVQKAEALETGLAYHKRIEELYKTGEVDASDFSKEAAMATAYKKYIYPKFKVNIVEDWLTFELPSGDEMIGRMDGMAEDGRLVEHKTTSMEITEEYEYDLQWDEQILAYMLMTGSREVWYTVCRKPTIRQKKNESDEEFFHRMVAWYDEDTESKIRLLLISRTDDDVDEYAWSLDEMGREMNRAEFYWIFYRNTSHCKCWGRRCEYSSICLNYDPDQEYVEFTKNKEG